MVVASLCKSKGVTHVHELIELTTPEIMQTLRLRNPGEAASFISTYSSQLLAQRLFSSTTCAELLSQRVDSARVSFGCPLLDNVFHGGLKLGTVTEIFGEAGAGKSQLCLQMCLRVVLPAEHGGLEGCAAYVDFESQLKLQRFDAMAVPFISAAQEQHKASDPHVLNIASLRDNLFVLSGQRDHEILMKEIESLLIQHKLPDQRRIKLVVIDSIAAMLRSEYQREEASARAHELWTIGQFLHHIAVEYDIAVVVVNQVSDVMDATDYQSTENFAATQVAPSDPTAGLSISHLLVSKQVVPTLGMTWSNCLHTRIQLSRTSMEITIPGAGGSRATATTTLVRKAQVVLSPELPSNTTFFVVEQTGIHGLSSDDLIPVN